MKQTILLSLIILLTACTSHNKKSIVPKSEKIDLTFSDNLSQLTIKEVNKLNEKKTSSVNDKDVVYMKSNCSTLREITDMTCVDNKQYISIENKAFNKKYFDFSLHNSSPQEIRDSIIIHLLASQLDLKINVTKKQIEHMTLSVDEQSKFSSFFNTVQSDTTKQRRIVSKMYYRYENTPIKEIIADINKHFKKDMCFDAEENPRIDFSFECNHWRETAMKLQKEMGLKITATMKTKTYYTIK